MKNRNELLARANYLGSIDQTLYPPVDWRSVKGYILSLESVPKDLEDEFIQVYKESWVVNN